MKAIRTWSEISYGLSETKRGASPKTRRFYKNRLNKARRQMDKAAIVEGLPQPPPVTARQWGEGVVIDNPCTKDQEIDRMWNEWKSQAASFAALRKQIQVESMWHNHTL